MSLADIMAKQRWTQMQVMQAPINSNERSAWIAIVRQWEEEKQKAAAGTVALGGQI